MHYNSDPSEDKIYQATKDLQNAGYDIEIKGTITDYLGVNFKYTDDGKIELTQPHLIDQIVEDSKILKKKFVPTSIPAKSSKIGCGPPVPQARRGSRPSPD